MSPASPFLCRGEEARGAVLVVPEVSSLFQRNDEQQLVARGWSSSFQRAWPPALLASLCTRTGTPSRRTYSRHFNGDVYYPLVFVRFRACCRSFRLTQLAKGGHVDHSMDSGGADDEPF